MHKEHCWPRYSGDGMKKRIARQEQIRKIVRVERIRTQRDLVDHLMRRGFVCTQATISRDIADMGLKKLPEGVYVLSEDMHLHRMIGDLVKDVVKSDKFVLIKASVGTASGVAAALDAADLGDVLGSIAGDDTVLVLAKDDKAADRIVETLNKYRGRS